MPWSNPFEVCNCPRRCGCGGGRESYVDAYARVLRIVRPYLVLEWGPGRNSRMAVEAGARVCAIESNEKYVPKDLRPDRFFCRITPVNSDDYILVSPYAHADLFFVDGRRRADCVHAVRACCLDRAVLCLHDAQRSRYHQALKTFEYVAFLERGFAVASRTLAYVEAITAQEREPA